LTDITAIVEAGDCPVDELVARAEHPDEFERDLAFLLSYTDFEEFPHRHPDILEAAWDEVDTIRELAAELDSAPEIMTRWLHVWGIREKYSGSLALQLQHNGGEPT